MAVRTNEEVEQVALESILRLIGEFKREPYHFLFESDLQATLLYHLRSRVSTTIAIPRSNGTPPPYRLNVVCSEYLKKFDIACVDLVLAKGCSTEQRKGFDIYIYNLPVFVGIELKYRKMGDPFGFNSCVADFDKLVKWKVPRRFVLGFIQDEAAVNAFLQTVPKEWVLSPDAEKVRAGTITVISPMGVFIYSRQG